MIKTILKTKDKVTLEMDWKDLSMLSRPVYSALFEYEVLDQTILGLSEKQLEMMVDELSSIIQSRKDESEQ